MLTREALTAAGWRLTSAHAASSYSVEVVVNPTARPSVMGIWFGYARMGR